MPAIFGFSDAVDSHRRCRCVGGLLYCHNAANAAADGEGLRELRRAVRAQHRAHILESDMMLWIQAAGQGKIS